MENMESRFETLATIVAEAFVIGYKCCLKNIEKNKPKNRSHNEPTANHTRNIRE